LASATLRAAWPIARRSSGSPNSFFTLAAIAGAESQISIPFAASNKPLTSLKLNSDGPDSTGTPQAAGSIRL